MTFLIVGEIPGTSHTIAPLTMLLVFGLLSLGMATYLFSGSIETIARHTKSLIDKLDKLEPRF